MVQAQSSPGGRPQPSILNEEECRGFQKAVELVGRRWTSAILLALSRGAGRFGEILALVDGLSDRLLSQRLKELEAEGLVVRTVIPTTPVQVRYELSGRGRELMIALQPLVNWGIAELRRDPRERDASISRGAGAPDGGTSTSSSGGTGP